MSSTVCRREISRGSSFKKQKKVVQRAGQESRRSKVDNLLNEAAGAAARQDIRGLYQVVRKLAPKQEYKRVQIHSKNGEILAPGEEMAELKVFFTNVYNTFHAVEESLITLEGFSRVHCICKC